MEIDLVLGRPMTMADINLDSAGDGMRSHDPN
jgi:hypothetical protein